VNEVHVVVPAGIDDPHRPSGGNLYDRRLCDELPAWGWAVREHLVPGRWPTPDAVDQARFDDLLAGLPDRAVVLVDGLIASASESLAGTTGRLRVVVLLHMPDATDHVEATVLRAAAGVVTTSNWSRDRVMAQDGIPADHVWTAIPGVDPVRPSAGSTDGRNLLMVGPVTPAKGHDVLVAALGGIADLDWHCVCAGSVDLHPAFVRDITAAAATANVADRLEFAGALSRPDLNAIRARTDLVISTSRREAYGMAVAEGLAAGIPVVATEVGGHPEAVGHTPDGTIPGALIPIDDHARLAATLRRWLTDSTMRDQWRHSAAQRSRHLTGWSDTARDVSAALTAVAGEPNPSSTAF